MSVQLYFLYGFPGEKKEFEKITLLQYRSNSQHTEKKIFTHGRTTYITKLNQRRNSDTIMQKLIVALNFGA